MRNINFKIDINKQNYIYEDCMQNDDIVLKITLLENGIPYNLRTNKVKLNWLKADGTFVLINTTKEINIINNVVNIILPRDCTRAIGVANFELSIVDINNKQVSTFPLSIEVIGSVLSGNKEPSKNLVTVIEELKEMIEIAKKQDNKKYTITTPMWGIINLATLEYSYVLEHNLKSKNLHITAYENLKNANIGAEIIDETHIRFTSDTNNAIDVILSSGYYGGYTSAKTESDITNIFNQLDNLDCGTW